MSTFPLVSGHSPVTFEFVSAEPFASVIRSDPDLFGQVGYGFGIIVPDPDPDLTF